MRGFEKTQKYDIFITVIIVKIKKIKLYSQTPKLQLDFPLPVLL